MTTRRTALTSAALALAILAWPTQAQNDAKPVTMPDSWAKALPWRSIGPANMGGRITALAVYEADPAQWWAATASGGLLKTTNDGTAFEHQFQHEATVSIGDVAVAQTDPKIVWVGTGESNPRNSVSWGDGVYKSTDGGATWTNMGLRQSFQIGRIAIHPQNPDIVYVGALGRLWGPNEERGLFKTTDGGATWTKVLYVDEHTGVIDVQMHPRDPETLLVATYQRQRDGFDSNDPAVKWGPGAGIHKTTDGGASWTRLSTGLPTCNLGRIGLNYARSNPDIIYAVVESERIAQEPASAAYAGLRGEDAEVGARLSEVVEGGPAAAADLRVGDIVLRLGESTVHSYNDLLRAIRRHQAGDTAQVEVSRERRSVVVELAFTKRPDAPAQEESEDEPPRRGGRAARSPFDGGLGGQRENMQEEQGPEGSEYGGIYRSNDGGRTWSRINSLNPRPMYFSQIRVDPSDENHVYVLGISLYKSSDGGTTFSDDGHRGGNGWVHVDHHALWINPRDGRHMILGNDGGLYFTRDRMGHWDHLNHMAIGQFYHVAVDSRPNYMVYGGLQDNGSWGGPSRVRHDGGPDNADWFNVGGGDGFVCATDPDDPDQVYFESQNGGMGRYNLRTGERSFIRPRPPRGTRYRFNWLTPFVLSPHNGRIYHVAGNYVFRSLDKGDGLVAISPEISRTDRGSASALAESPLTAGVLYVGTDDGALWMTRSGGHEWVNLFDSPEQAAPPADAPADAGDNRPAGGGGPGRGPRGGGGRMAQMLSRADQNGDGLIQRDEVPERMRGFFERLDANGDGALDREEIAAARPGGGPGGEPPASADVTIEATAAPAAALPDQAPPAPADAERAPAPSESASAPAAAETAATPAPAESAAAPSAPAAPADTAAPSVPAAPEGAFPDPLSGEWEGQARNEQIPAGQGKFKLTLSLAQDGTVTGHLTSPFNDGDIDPGRYDRDSGALRFGFSSDQMTLDFTATVTGSGMSGAIDAEGGAFTLEFEARRTAQPAPAAPAATATTAAPAAAPAPNAARPLRELVPGPRWVASLACSRFEAGRVYLALDGHRSNDDELYAFVSEDFGKSWRSIRSNLPASAGSVRVLREDITSPDILYLGAEFSAWVSVDRGTSWTQLNGTLPTVAVHEFAQHPTTGEIAVATHGRSIWIVDVSALRQVSGETLARGATLFAPRTTHYWRDEPSRGTGLRRFVGSNPADAAVITYALGRGADFLELRVTDAAGKTLRQIEAPREAGFHQVQWDLRAERRGGPPAGPPGRRGGRGGSRVEPGTYYVALTVGEEEIRQPLVVRGDPEFPDAVLWGEEYDLMLDELERQQEGEEGAAHDDDVIW